MPEPCQPDLIGAPWWPFALTSPIEAHHARREEAAPIPDSDLSRIVPDAAKFPAFTFNFTGVAPAEAGKPQRVAFHATAVVQRAEFGMVRDLLSEIGKTSSAPDVWIEIHAEALAAGPQVR